MFSSFHWIYSYNFSQLIYCIPKNNFEKKTFHIFSRQISYFKNSFACLSLCEIDGNTICYIHLAKKQIKVFISNIKPHSLHYFQNLIIFPWNWILFSNLINPILVTSLKVPMETAAIWLFRLKTKPVMFLGSVFKSAELTLWWCPPLKVL